MCSDPVHVLVHDESDRIQKSHNFFSRTVQGVFCQPISHHDLVDPVRQTGRIPFFHSALSGQSVQSVVDSWADHAFFSEIIDRIVLRHYCEPITH
jgi:hypothetical protein